MQFAVFGSGPGRLVIIPGMSLKSVMFSADAVASVYSCFAKDYTVYLFDRKVPLEEDCSVVGMAGDMVKALNALGIVNADFFGTSQGGMIALTIAARYPSLVRRLAVSSTLARQNEVCRSTMETWERLSASGSPVELNRDVFSKVYSPSYYERYRMAFARLEESGTPEEMRRFALLARATRQFDIYGELDNVSCPVFVTGVENDTVLSGTGCREIAGKLGCRIKMYPGSGHAVYDEDRGYTRMLLEFFNEGRV